MNKPIAPAVRRWRVVWAIEHPRGMTNGVDFVDAPDAEAAALMVAMAHSGCVITYTAPDTRDPIFKPPRKGKVKP